MKRCRSCHDLVELLDTAEGLMDRGARGAVLVAPLSSSCPAFTHSPLLHKRTRMCRPDKPLPPATPPSARTERETGCRVPPPTPAPAATRPLALPVSSHTGGYVRGQGAAAEHAPGPPPPTYVHVESVVGAGGPPALAAQWRGSTLLAHEGGCQLLPRAERRRESAVSDVADLASEMQRVVRIGAGASPAPAAPVGGAWRMRWGDVGSSGWGEVEA